MNPDNETASKELILLIDDEKEFVELLQSQLELFGYTVITAFDGTTGLKMACDRTPDIVICDIKMPGMNGFEVLHEFRKRKNICTPFVMLSALTDFSNVQMAYKAEADYYISKPVELEKLKDNIRTLLNISKTKINSPRQS